MLNKKYSKGSVTKILMSKRKKKRINFSLIKRTKREVWVGRIYCFGILIFKKKECQTVESSSKDKERTLLKEQSDCCLPLPLGLVYMLDHNDLWNMSRNYSCRLCAWDGKKKGMRR